MVQKARPWAFGEGGRRTAEAPVLLGAPDALLRQDVGKAFQGLSALRAESPSMEAVLVKCENIRSNPVG